MGASELGGDYQRARERLKREAPHICAYCGQWIDIELDRKDPMSWSADHIIALDNGGDPTSIENLQPMHKSCNSKKGNRVKRKHRGSRQW